MEALAARALERSRQLDWRLLELASQLRISTIDSFCRDLAIQQPIYSGIGNNLQISERPTELYRRAARATLQKLGDPAHPVLSDAIKDLLLWRDNGWKELEDLLVKMLGQRDRWMHTICAEPGAGLECNSRMARTTVRQHCARRAGQPDSTLQPGSRCRR